MSKSRVTTLFVCIVSLFILILVFETRKDILRWKYSNKDFRSEVGTWGYLTDDIYSTIKDSFPVSNNKAREIIDEFKNSREIVPYFKARTESIRNVVFIQLEGIDAITLELKIGESYVMPYLHQLKEQGLYMDHAYDQTGSGRTSDGEFLAITSLLPIKSESMYLRYSLENIESLPKILRGEGFRAISIHGYEGGFYNRRIAHSELGYEESWFEDDLKEEAQEDDYLGWGLSDEFILDKVASLLDERDKTFLHVITLSNHHPFDAVSGKYADVILEEPQNIVECYLNSVNYVDHAIGGFVQTLKEKDLWDQTLLVIFSDHDSGITQEIYEYFDLAYNRENKECDKIPLLFVGKGLQGKENMISGQADIMPMVLSYLGIDIPDVCMGLNYIEGGKIVYLQEKDVTEIGLTRRSSRDIGEVTKCVIRYKKPL